MASLYVVSPFWLHHDALSVDRTFRFDFLALLVVRSVTRVCLFVTAS